MKNTSINQGQRVFTCGHSFHEWIAPIVAELADSAEIVGHEIAGHSAFGGSTPGRTPVAVHWDVPEAENRVLPALRAGAVDVLTLSPIWLPDEAIEQFAAFALAHNPQVRITVQEFWLPNDNYNPIYPLQKYEVIDHNATDIEELKRQHALYFADMEAMVREVNEKLGQQVVYIVPTAQAVIALREKIIAGQAPGLDNQEQLFADSWGHVNQHVMTLNAYCHFAVIYRRSPVGLPVPTKLAEAGLTFGDALALNGLLQELAWKAVVDHPMAGVPRP